MELIKEIIDRGREVQDLLEAQCHHEASFAIATIEEMLMQLPAGVEDWAHALQDEFRLLGEAKQWMVRDHFLAIQKIEQAIAGFERVNRQASEHEVAPELPEDVGVQAA